MKRTPWPKIRDGEIAGVVRPLDNTIHSLRLAGASLSQIGDAIGKRKSYVQHRLARIAAREVSE